MVKTADLPVARWLVLCACMLAGTAFGDGTYSWPEGTTVDTAVEIGTVEAPLATGSLAVPAGGASAASFSTVLTPSATLSVTGGTVSFGLDAYIRSANGLLDWTAPISSPAGLAFSLPPNLQRSFSGIALPVPPNNATPVTVLENCDLSVYTPVSAVACGTYMSGLKLKAYNVVRSENMLTVQFQSRLWSEGQAKWLFRSLKAEFTQDGNDIKGRVLYCLYCWDVGQLGDDTDTEDFSTSRPGVNAYGNENPPVYGIDSAIFERIVGVKADMSFSGPMSVAGDLTVDPKVSATFEPGTLSASGAITNALDAAAGESPGSLTVRLDEPDVAIDSTFKGGGELVFEAVRSPSRELYIDCIHTNGSDFFPTAWTVIATNALLSSVTNASNARIGGSSITSSPSTGATVCYFSNDGLYARFLVEAFTSTDVAQGKTFTCKAVEVELRQRGMNIEMRSARGLYKSNWTAVAEGYDFFNEARTGDMTPSTGGYMGRKVRLDMDRCHVAATYRGIRSSSSFTTSTLRLKGGDEAGLIFWPTNRYFTPVHKDGSLHVHDGAVLCVRAYGSRGDPFVMQDASIFVHTGGLMVAASQVVPQSTGKIEVDGGMILLGALFSTTRYSLGGDSECYFNRLVLKNGARVKGAAARLGITSERSSWTVEGISPSYVENNIQFLSKAATTSMTGLTTTNTLDVADVTGDDGADLIVVGNLKQYNAKYASFVVEKTGAGTIRFDGASTMTNRVFVREGCLRYAADALSGDCNFTLAGGSLAFDGATTNSVATLSVAEDGGSITLGADASFTAASADIGGHLAVTLAEGATLYIGSSRCLTAAELRKVSIGDWPRTVQGDDGRLHGVTAGLRVILK